MKVLKVVLWASLPACISFGPLGMVLAYRKPDEMAFPLIGAIVTTIGLHLLNWKINRVWKAVQTASTAQGKPLVLFPEMQAESK